MVDAAVTSTQRLSLPQTRRDHSRISPKTATYGSVKRDFLSPRDALVQVNSPQHRLSHARSVSDSLAATDSRQSHQHSIHHDATPFNDIDNPGSQSSLQEYEPALRRLSLQATDLGTRPDLLSEAVVASSRRTSISSVASVASVNSVATSSSKYSPPRSRMLKPSMGKSKLDRLLGRRIDWQRLPTSILDTILEQLRLSHVNKMSFSCTTCYMRDLCALQLVCRWWELPAQKKLYSYIELLGDDDPAKMRKMKIMQGVRLTLLRRTLRSRPMVASLVKGLYVADACMSPYRSNGMPNPDYDEYVGLLASLVMSCPNLETFDGFYPIYNHTYDRVTHALSTRKRLKQHVWIIADKASGKARSQSQLTNGLVESDRVYEFLQYHRSWDQLQTLMLCSRGSSEFLAHQDVMDMFARLPGLQNLCLRSFKADEFDDATLMTMPKLRMLRLEDCAGVTDAGLSEWASSSASIMIQKLSLINQNVTKLETIARIFCQLVNLRRFSIVQSDKIPDVPVAGVSKSSAPTSLLLASETVQFLHWDIGADPSALRAYEEQEDADLKDLAGKDGLHPNVYLAISISRGGFPSLTHLRAPQDVAPSGVLQSVCRPARNGKMLLSGDNYVTPRMDPTLNTNSLRAARIRAQGVITRHLQKRKAWMTIVITDHSHQEPYIPQPLSASSTGSSTSTTRTTSTDMTEVEDDAPLESEKTVKDSSLLMVNHTPFSTRTGGDNTTGTDPTSIVDQTMPKPRDNSPPPKRLSRPASTHLSPIKIPSADTAEKRTNEPLKIREHVLPTFVGRVSVHMDDQGQIFHPPRFYLLPDIHGHDENGGLAGWDDFLKMKERAKARGRAFGDEDEDREGRKDGCEGTWNKWVVKEDPTAPARTIKEPRENWRHWRRPRVKEGMTVTVQDFF